MSVIIYVWESPKPFSAEIIVISRIVIKPLFILFNKPIDKFIGHVSIEFEKEFEDNIYISHRRNKKGRSQFCENKNASNKNNKNHDYENYEEEKKERGRCADLIYQIDGCNEKIMLENYCERERSYYKEKSDSSYSLLENNCSKVVAEMILSNFYKDEEKELRKQVEEKLNDKINDKTKPFEITYQHWNFAIYTLFNVGKEPLIIKLMESFLDLLDDIFESILCKLRKRSSFIASLFDGVIKLIFIALFFGLAIKLADDISHIINKPWTNVWTPNRVNYLIEILSTSKNDKLKVSICKDSSRDNPS